MGRALSILPNDLANVADRRLVVVGLSGQTGNFFCVNSNGNADASGNVFNIDALYNIHVANGGTFGGTVTASGFASTSPHTPTAVTLGASPFNFTNTAAACMKYRLSGAVAYSVTVDGVAVFGSLAGDIGDTIQPGEYITVTYTSVPTLYTNLW